MTLATTIQTVIDSGNQINEAYPIAGQDNNTQGFRDNFSKTQTGLQSAGNALGELNTRTPKIDLDNDFADVGAIQNAVVLALKGSTTDITINSSAETIDVGEADYFRLRVSQDCPALTLSGWPNIEAVQLYRKVRLEFFSPTQILKTIKFNPDNSYAKIKYDNLAIFDPTGDGLAIETGSVIVDAWVSDNSNDTDTGLTIYLQYIGTFVQE